MIRNPNKFQTELYINYVDVSANYIYFISDTFIDGLHMNNAISLFVKL